MDSSSGWEMQETSWAGGKQTDDRVFYELGSCVYDNDVLNCWGAMHIREFEQWQEIND
jgi:hypothetical protein